MNTLSYIPTNTWHRRFLLLSLSEREVPTSVSVPAWADYCGVIHSAQHRPADKLRLAVQMFKRISAPCHDLVFLTHFTQSNDGACAKATNEPVSQVHKDVLNFCQHALHCLHSWIKVSWVRLRSGLVVSLLRQRDDTVLYLNGIDRLTIAVNVRAAAKLSTIVNPRMVLEYNDVTSKTKTLPWGSWQQLCYHGFMQAYGFMQDQGETDDTN